MYTNPEKATSKQVPTAISTASGEKNNLVSTAFGNATVVAGSQIQQAAAAQLMTMPVAMSLSGLTTLPLTLCTVGGSAGIGNSVIQPTASVLGQAGGLQTGGLVLLNVGGNANTNLALSQLVSCGNPLSQLQQAAQPLQQQQQQQQQQLVTQPQIVNPMMWGSNAVGLSSLQESISLQQAQLASQFTNVNMPQVITPQSQVQLPTGGAGQAGATAFMIVPIQQVPVAPGISSQPQPTVVQNVQPSLQVSAVPSSLQASAVPSSLQVSTVPSSLQVSTVPSSLQASAVPLSAGFTVVSSPSVTTAQLKTSTGNVQAPQQMLSSSVLGNSVIGHWPPSVTCLQQSLPDTAGQRLAADFPPAKTTPILKPFDLLVQAGQLSGQIGELTAAQQPALPKKPVHDPHISSTMQPNAFVRTSAAEPTSLQSVQEPHVLSADVTPVAVDIAGQMTCEDDMEKPVAVAAHLTKPRSSPALSPSSTSQNSFVRIFTPPPTTSTPTLKSSSPSSTPPTLSTRYNFVASESSRPNSVPSWSSGLGEFVSSPAPSEPAGGGKPAVREKRKKGPAPKLDGDELCSICLDKASGYHYGVLTCEGCKGFFRRSIKKGLEYKCKGDGNCQMDAYMRRKCQKCRLDKCRSVGMRDESVLLESRPKKIKREECNKDHPSPSCAGASLTSDGESPPRLTSQQLGLVQMLQANEARFQWPTQENVAKVTPWVEVGDSHKCRASRFAHFTELSILIVQLVVEFTKQLPGFMSVSREDQIVLLKACTIEVMLLRAAKQYQGKSKAINFLNGKFYDKNSFYRAGIQVEFVDPIFDFCNSMSKLGLDEAEYALLAAINTFSADRPNIKDGEKVEALQDSYVELLRVYLKIHHPDDPLMFPRTLMKLVELRTLNNYHSEQMFALKVQDKQLPPLLAEIWDM